MKYIVVDIDGTISKVGDRLKYLQEEPKNWDKFYDSCFEDKPIHVVIDLVQILYSIGFEVVFCTGRRESCREDTNKWLSENVAVLNYQLLMRGNNDYRHDTEVKPELLRKAGLAPQDVEFVLEDRDSVVQEWRRLGFACFQVANGNF